MELGSHARNDNMKLLYTRNTPIKEWNFASAIACAIRSSSFLQAVRARTPVAPKLDWKQPSESRTNRIIPRVLSLKVISHREVHLKLLVAAIQGFFQYGAEDNRDIWKAFGNTYVYRITPMVTILKIDFCFVIRSDRPVVREDKAGR